MVGRRKTAFEQLVALLEPVGGLDIPWCVAGGWAIDLWLGRATRSRHDVDLLVARADQPAVHEHFADRTLVKVVPHPDGVVGEGSLMPWDGGWLDLPLCQVFADAPDGARIEIVSGEIHGGMWRYWRNPEVELPLDRLVVTGATEVPALAPDVVLLFKAPLQRPRNEADLTAVLPDLSAGRRIWLAEAVERSHPANPRIGRLG